MAGSPALELAVPAGAPITAALVRSRFEWQRWLPIAMPLSADVPPYGTPSPMHMHATPSPAGQHMGGMWPMEGMYPGMMPDLAASAATPAGADAASPWPRNMRRARSTGAMHPSAPVPASAPPSVRVPGNGAARSQSTQPPPSAGSPTGRHWSDSLDAAARTPSPAEQSAGVATSTPPPDPFPDGSGGPAAPASAPNQGAARAPRHPARGGRAAPRARTFYRKRVASSGTAGQAGIRPAGAAYPNALVQHRPAQPAGTAAAPSALVSTVAAAAAAGAAIGVATAAAAIAHQRHPAEDAPAPRAQLNGEHNGRSGHDSQ